MSIQIPIHFYEADPVANQMIFDCAIARVRDFWAWPFLVRSQASFLHARRANTKETPAGRGCSKSIFKATNPPVLFQIKCDPSLVLMPTSFHPGVLLCIADAFASARASLDLGLKVAECRLDRYSI